MEPTAGFMLHLVATMVYGSAALVFVYAALNDLLQERAGTFELSRGLLAWPESQSPSSPSSAA
jgi:hypothetical protein